MRGGFVKTIIEKKLLVIIFVIMIAVGGIASYITIPKQHFPEVTMPVAMVGIVYPGASAEDMEELVTKKLEDVVREIDGFDSCTTTTMNGVSAAMVVLELSMTQDEADKSFDDLRTRIQELRSDLPAGVAAVSVNTDIMETAGLILAVTGTEITGDELTQRTEILADQLKLLAGVKKVEVSGQQNSEVAIHVDSDRLNLIDLSLSELAGLIGSQNSIVPTGKIEVNDSVLTVNSSGKFADLDEIRNIVVGQADSGTTIRLCDIAEINIEEPEDTAYYTFNGQKSNLIALYFESGINVLDFGESIRQCIDDYGEHLPQSIQVNEVYFQPDTVSSAVNSFVSNLLESIILVLIVVMLGMNLRNALVVSIAIPLSIFINFIVMRILGIEIQFVSLAALIVVLGMLVDNAIVVSDSIQTKLDEGRTRKEAAIEGTREVAAPVFISMLTTVSAFASLLALTGVYRQLVISLPIVIVTCLFASFAVSLLITPLFSFFLLKPTSAQKDGSHKMAGFYNRVFSKAFRYRKKTLLISMAFFALCSIPLFFIELQVIPKAFKDIITIEIKGVDENDIDKTENLVNQVEQILERQPEVSYYLSGVGIGIPRYDFSIQPKSSGNNVGDVFVRIDLSDSSRFQETHEMMDFLQKELDNAVSGGTVLVDELGIIAGTTKPIEIKLYSEDLNDLNQSAEMVADMMRQIEGTKNINGDQEVATYNYYIDMDTKKLNSLGLMKGEVQNELNIALMERTVSLYRENGKEYNVVLDSELMDLNALKNYRVKASSSGSKHSLHQFSDVRYEPEVSSITRLNGQRGRVVSCYCESAYSDIMSQMKLEKMLKTADFPDNVSIEMSGMKKDFFEALSSIAGIAVLSVAVIFLILIFQFNSLRLPLLIFVSVPFGIMSGITGLFFTNERLTFFGLLGVVSLLGCVLANAIMLVEFIEVERKSGASIEEACLNAGKKRFRPILMSTMTTVLGLIPLAFGGDALFVPMSRLMMVGMAVAMVVNLILVPILYSMIMQKSSKRTNEIEEK